MFLEANSSVAQGESYEFLDLVRQSNRDSPRCFPSGLNGTLMIRGTKDDYDHWRNLGNPGWGWDDVLPLFKKVSFPHGTVGIE